MRKAYIQPEAELLSLALLEDFLSGSSEITDDDVTVGGGTAGGEGGTSSEGATDTWTDGSTTPGAGGTVPGGDEWEDDGIWG